MRKYLVCIGILFLLLAPKLHGQEMYYNIWSDFHNTPSKTVFADTAKIRSAPGTNSLVTDTLYAGDTLFVIATEKQELTLKGFTAPWLKVRYNVTGVQKTGYIWAGLVSFERAASNNTTFVYGLDLIRSKDSVFADGEKVKLRECIVKLKAVQNRKVVSARGWVLGSEESLSYTTAKLTKGKGLATVLNLVEVVFSGEACGIPTLTYTYAWNGKQLIALPELMDVGDADVYWHEERFVYPADKGGKPSLLTWKMKEAESTEKTDKKGNTIYKESSATKTYRWTGDKFILQ
ncbi:SH3 domain-containing protein [Sediminibacterium ginsengisoli]|uniref:SH3 domain-containing protein n=1 Tax=Sediminibacterium ginsengisoli TaxID=413434 RepID=A0A1T4PS56_9BACT|nr:SH3 domain-containing protein [Sediminibacterium ginsengisoli]SJZ94383.1 SH3 domain-containing protein [Sediminibacterium ginsengisoli]